VSKYDEIGPNRRRGSLMKSTGIVRKVDELGRVVIPIELRRTLDINIKDPLEIYVDNDKVVLKKYQPNMACQITGESSDQNISLANGKIVLSPEGAKQLIEEIQSQFK
jgi:AbrB family transcriptional regulator, transcriptional pleiotropic regulator of transition state genes